MAQGRVLDHHVHLPNVIWGGVYIFSSTFGNTRAKQHLPVAYVVKDEGCVLTSLKLVITSPRESIILSS